MNYDEYEIDEYERDHAHPCKCRETCAKCRFSSCLDNDEECDFCPNFDRKKRRCKCFDIERGGSCPYYVEVDE